MSTVVLSLLLMAVVARTFVAAKSCETVWCRLPGKIVAERHRCSLGVALQNSYELSVLKASHGFKVDSSCEYSRATPASANANAAHHQTHLGTDTQCSGLFALIAMSGTLLTLWCSDYFILLLLEMSYLLSVKHGESNFPE